MDADTVFLRAIQANPSDATPTLAYADWLDERGEHDKAEYLRLVTQVAPPNRATDAQSRRLFALRRQLHAWLDLLEGRVPLIWDAATLFALGQLRGLLHGYAALNTHESDTAYDFDVRLHAHTGCIDELLASHFVPDLAPVNAEELPNWEADLRTVLRDWLFFDLRELRGGPYLRLAFFTDRGRDWLIDGVIGCIRGVINPTRGWRLQVTPSRFYALEWADLALEGADRVLFLHFSFSD